MRRQLRDEETALAAALPLLRAAHEAFGQGNLDAFAKALTTHQQSLNLMEEINRRRQRFRAMLASRLDMEPTQITWADTLARVPIALRADLSVQVVRVRRGAEELASMAYALSVQLRIYLDAYRRLLRDVTNTASNSGRYGRAGTTESLEYCSMIQIHG